MYTLPNQNCLAKADLPMTSNRVRPFSRIKFTVRPDLICQHRLSIGYCRRNDNHCRLRTSDPGGIVGIESA